MSLETQLTEALNGIGWLSDMHVETDDDFDADVVHAVTERLASLAHDGVLVVDFRTKSAGEVLPSKFERIPDPDCETCEGEGWVDDEEDGGSLDCHDCRPVFALVRPNDGSDQ